MFVNEGNTKMKHEKLETFFFYPIFCQIPTHLLTSPITHQLPPWHMKPCHFLKLLLSAIGWKRYLPSYAYMSSGVHTIGYCCSDWHRMMVKQHHPSHSESSTSSALLDTWPQMAIESNVDSTASNWFWVADCLNAGTRSKLCRKPTIIKWGVIIRNST